MSDRKGGTPLVQLVRLRPFLVSLVFLVDTNPQASLRLLIQIAQIGPPLTHDHVFTSMGCHVPPQ